MRHKHTNIVHVALLAYNQRYMDDITPRQVIYEHLLVDQYMIVWQNMFLQHKWTMVIALLFFGLTLALVVYLLKKSPTQKNKKVRVVHSVAVYLLSYASALALLTINYGDDFIPIHSLFEYDSISARSLQVLALALVLLSGGLAARSLFRVILVKRWVGLRLLLGILFCLLWVYTTSLGIFDIKMSQHGGQADMGSSVYGQIDNEAQ